MHPITVSFISFLFGQLVGSMLLSQEELGGVLICLCFFAALVLFAPGVRRSVVRVPLLTTLLGILSVTTTLPRSESSEHQTLLPSVTFKGVVVDGVSRRIPNEMRFGVQILSITPSAGGKPGSRIWCKATEVPWRELSGLRSGDSIAARASFAPWRENRNPFSFESKMRRKGYLGKCRIIFGAKSPQEPSSLTAAKEGFLAKHHTHYTAALLLSMVFGFDEAVTLSIERAFKATGLIHLLVFSGAQVMVAYYISHWGSTKLRAVLWRHLHIRLPLSCTWIAGFLSATFLVLFVGLPTTGIRALAALSISLGALFIGRGTSLGSSILLSAFVMSILYPGTLLEPSMHLTYAALWGIWLGLRRGGGVVRVMGGASCGTAAISLLWFGEFSLIGFLLNPILVPIIGAISLVGGVAWAGVGAVAPEAQWIIEVPLFFILGTFEHLVYLLSLFTWSSVRPPVWVQWPLGLSVLVILVCVSLLPSQNKTKEAIKVL